MNFYDLWYIVEYDLNDFYLNKDLLKKIGFFDFDINKNYNKSYYNNLNRCLMIELKLQNYIEIPFEFLNKNIDEIKIFIENINKTKILLIKKAFN